MKTKYKEEKKRKLKKKKKKKPNMFNLREEKYNIKEHQLPLYLKLKKIVLMQ